MYHTLKINLICYEKKIGNFTLNIRLLSSHSRREMSLGNISSE